MLQAWDLLALALCLLLALLALLRGIAGLLVARRASPRLEAASLTTAGAAGLAGVALVAHLLA